MTPSDAAGRGNPAPAQESATWARPGAGHPTAVPFDEPWPFRPWPTLAELEG